MKVSFNLPEEYYILTATNYGCDIFVNGRYLDTTLKNEESHSKEYWIGKGIEWVFEFKNRCNESMGK